jgi:hypothetical protein
VRELIIPLAIAWLCCPALWTCSLYVRGCNEAKIVVEDTNYFFKVPRAVAIP